MTFRFILQPAMAIVAASRDGIHDARIGAPLLLGVALSHPGGRSGRLWEGIVSTARIIILGVVMDALYQWVVFKTFYPVQAAVIAILLAFVPYSAVAWPVRTSRASLGPGVGVQLARVEERRWRAPISSWT